MSKFIDLLRASGGEASLSSALGFWRQKVSTRLAAVMAGVEGSGDDGGGGDEGGGVAALLTFGSFYAMMPGDNTATIATGAPMLFPQTGPASGITRVPPVGDALQGSPSEFILPVVGTYDVYWQVSTDEGDPGAQLQLELDGTPLDETVSGRFTGTNQLVNRVMITTTVANSILRLINPAGNSTALTITPIAGGPESVSAWLVIRRLA